MYYWDPVDGSTPSSEKLVSVVVRRMYYWDLQTQPVENKGFSYVPVCQLSKGIYLFKQKFHFLIRLLKAIRRITDQDSFKGTGLK